MTTEAPTQEQIRNAWDTIAAGFDEYVTPHNLGPAEEALHRAGLEPGMRFLDVAAGTGALSIPAARAGAEVVATDFAPGMIERLRTRSRSIGLSNIDARVMDGESLDLEDDTFDVSGSQHGVSLFPDMSRGLAEMVRVTKPGGRVLVVAAGPIPKAEFIGFFAGAMKTAVPGFVPMPTDPPPLPFQVADPDALRDKLIAAGLSDVHVAKGDWPMHFESADQYWHMFTSSNPIGKQLSSQASTEQRAEVLRVLDGMFRERSGGQPDVVLHTEINIGVGTK